MKALAPIICIVASLAASLLWLAGWAALSGMHHGSGPAFDGQTLALIWGVAAALLVPGLLALILWRKSWSGAGRIVVLAVGYCLGLYLSGKGALGTTAQWSNDAARDFGSIEQQYAVLFSIIFICGLALLASAFSAQWRTAKG